jgi:hypothetical protein
VIIVIWTIGQSDNRGNNPKSRQLDAGVSSPKRPGPRVRKGVEKFFSFFVKNARLINELANELQKSIELPDTG